MRKRVSFVVTAAVAVTIGVIVDSRLTTVEGQGNPQGQSFAAEPTVNLVNGWQRNNLRAVAFVQERGTRRILGSAKLELSDIRIGTSRMRSFSLIRRETTRDTYSFPRVIPKWARRDQWRSLHRREE